MVDPWIIPNWKKKKKNKFLELKVVRKGAKAALGVQVRNIVLDNLGSRLVLTLEQLYWYSSGLCDQAILPVLKVTSSTLFRILGAQAQMMAIWK